VAKQYKPHRKKVSVWSKSNKYTTGRWLCGQAVQATPQEGECVAKQYKLHHKKASSGQAVQATLQEGECVAKE
jgi:hypothetical protein